MSGTEVPTTRISVVIPTRNGGAVFEETLRAVLAQRVECAVEVIVVDTASTDGTPEAAERILADPALNPAKMAGRVHRIALDEFGHGRTRNLGCRMAQGEFLVFLSQDATPIGTDWLGTLLRPFADPDVAGAFCRQVPRHEASLPERFILRKTYPPRSSARAAIVHCAPGCRLHPVLQCRQRGAAIRAGGTAI